MILRWVNNYEVQSFAMLLSGERTESFLAGTSSAAQLVIRIIKAISMHDGEFLST